MEQTIQFFVDDTSPTIAYSPISDTFSTPNLTASWNPYYTTSGFARSIGDIGEGDSYHVTSLNGASLSISWKGTGVQLFGYTNGSNYDVFLDGTVQTTLGDDLDSKILANLQNLTQAVHNVTLQAKLPASTHLLFPSLFFDKALLTTEAEAANNTTVTSQKLPDTSVLYAGQWSSQTVASRLVHTSNNVGDSTSTTFNGSSFTLTGMTSPDSGNYSITLDNQTTSYLGRSSFIHGDALLFSATGLDPNRTHLLKVTNEDGHELSINADGFTVFVAQPQPVPPKPTPSPAGALSTSPAPIAKGTIAALVLGGILAFLALTGFLLFWFVIRPRRRRARQDPDARPQTSIEPKEPRQVLNIAPPLAGHGGVYTYNSDLGYVRDDESATQQDQPANRVSAQSGFARWKRDLEMGLEGLGLSIRFRHSDSTGGRTNRQSRTNSESAGGEQSATRSRFGSGQGSWTRMSWKGKKKAKGSPKGSNGSWSPGVALELPVRPSSHTSLEETKDKEHPDSKPPSLTSGLDSLSYMSYPQVQPAPVLTTPHAYAFTHDNARRSSQQPPERRPLGPRQSLPRTFTTMQTTHDNGGNHSRQESAGLLLTHGGEPNITIEEEMSQLSPNYGAVIGTVIPPTPHDPGRGRQLQPGSTSRDDRGSSSHSGDESTSFLGPSTARHAIRSLSPRTSHVGPSEAAPSLVDRPASRDKHLHPSAQPVAGSSKGKLKESTKKTSRSEEKRPDTGQTHNSSGPDSSFLEVGSPENSTLNMRAEEDASMLSSASPPQIRSSFLEMSPLQLDLFQTLAAPSQPGPTGSTHPSPQEERRTTMISTVTSEESKVVDPQPTSRLTPDVRPSAHGHPTRERNGSVSFLDFSSSSDASSRTRSVATSEFSSRFAGSISAQLQQQYPPPSFPQGHQRISTALSHTTEQTQSSFISGPSSSPPPNRDSFFPYPVTFAPSSPFYNPSMQQMQAAPPQPEPPRQASNRPPQLAPIVVPPPDVGNVRASTGSDGLGRHPTSIMISPTDSVPMSVSELRFRHSHGDSTSGSLSARLPPHPPLPGSARSRTEFTGPAPLSPPSYIVQQVLGRSPDPQETPGPESLTAPPFSMPRTTRPG